MAPLGRLLALPTMTDEQMVNELRLALLDANAPTPSVETLLHAALPATFIDHTHADALLSVVDQADARSIAEDIFGASLLVGRSCRDSVDLLASLECLLNELKILRETLPLDPTAAKEDAGSFGANRLRERGLMHIENVESNASHRSDERVSEELLDLSSGKVC